MDIRDDLAALRKRIKRQLARPGEFVEITDEAPAEEKRRRGRARNAARHGAPHPKRHGKAHHH